MLENGRRERMNKSMTIEELEREIARLSASLEVKIARKEQQIRHMKQQYLFSLQNIAKRGRELMDAGITMEDLREIEERFACDSDFFADELPDYE